MSPSQTAHALIVGLAAASLAAPALATPSTTDGHVSIAQVMHMLDTAPHDRMAQQVLTAYLAGVGETASIMAGMGDAICRTTLSLSAENVRRAVSVSAARNQAETPATHVIVQDMLERAGCNRR
ncbi:MAG: chlorophyllide reductase [Proteobacteria bacterium]|nr:chlorophyllide reductase [Pseudomonadota bacterium]